ncbi:MAG: RNA polymerase sigma factor [Cellulomonas sp.]|jgi:RNA polymerase sigma-70 factor (ECF subfamily)|nr:RNA polymerase sigma factor [Cellulomonas sp.]
MATSDSDLLARACSGDQQAFEALVAPHRRTLWGVCLRITGNHHLAEDALQDALLAAWRNLAQFRGESAVSTWLYRIASNAALAQVRRRRDETVEAIPETADEWADPQHGVAERDRVAEALRQVPPDFREALVLREYGDFTYEQIAAHQGIGVQTVKSRLSRARAALRAVLAES